MKKKIHPPYRQVLFVDSASGYKFVCGSTLVTKATETYQDVEYPVSYLSISSASHPFFTGSKQLVDSEGRVEKFKKRFERKAIASQPDQKEEEGTPDKKNENKTPSPKKAVAKKSPVKK